MVLYLLAEVAGGCGSLVCRLNILCLQHHVLCQLAVGTQAFERQSPVGGCRDVCNCMGKGGKCVC